MIKRKKIYENVYWKPKRAIYANGEKKNSVRDPARLKIRKGGLGKN